MKKFKPDNSQTGLPRKKVFECILLNFATVGIEPSIVAQPYPINVRILMGFGILGAYMFCNFKYTFYEAKTFIEYSQTTYIGSGALLIAIYLLVIVLKIEKLFKFINDCEHIVNLGEYNVFGSSIHGQFH